MEKKDQYIDENKVSPQQAIENISMWLSMILRKKWWIVMAAVFLAALLFGYNQLKKLKYSASTSFVLETGASDGLGQFSSLANLAGINLNSTGSGAAFQIDNIIKLYTSYRMLSETLLTEAEFNGKSTLLIDRYAENKGLRKRWNKVEELTSIDFHLPREQFTIAHDSLIKEVIKELNEGGLSVDKPDRKMSILVVNVVDHDELFAKAFNEALVHNVNEFYAKTTTSNSGENLRILQSQADSLKLLLDKLILDFARLSEENPNLNPLRLSEQVPLQKTQVDIQITTASYTEIIKNLEIAKITHRNNQPLVQIIDSPILPLDNNKWTTFRTLLGGLFFGGLLMILYLSIKQIIMTALKE
ncbi:GumC domain-containing protein [Roseivirga misakiensis]|uniref:Polysaccharide chain length determinant N-terminal domain-containing protein n=1 Tax=Roseivirga misakiensis TaxID=1563681 RepID=A0A1E5T5U7_9BACT|nr:hypothetical protein [Roseivirga misakiensis]OEK06764.1 hypothetical protein BFP71_03635 [Roseivirga misakiensis]